MAKAKKSQPDKPKQLTDAQVKELAKRIVNTRQNIYVLCESQYNVTADDSTFELIRKVGGVARCENCSTWKPVDHFDNGGASDEYCSACMDEI